MRQARKSVVLPFVLTFLALTGLVLALESAPGLKSSFSYSPRYPVAGQTVAFNDASMGSPVSWQWDFGDGAVSSLPNPTHAFGAPGFFRVSLTVSDGGATKTVSRTIAVLAQARHTASFRYSPSYPAVAEPIQFTDTSTGSPTSWLWDFGDGSSSSSQNPSHAFQKKGFFKVVLTTTKGSVSQSARRTITVMKGAALAAGFMFSPTSPSAGQSVQFTDASTGGPTAWSWDFGDGSTSTLQNPSHAFTSAGSKTVTLTATNATGSSTATRTVTVGVGLSASFTFSPSSPTAGQSVQFTDTSVGGPTAWSWNFGDGSTSTLRNPAHSYTTAGSKTVTLTATNATGSSTATRTVTVTAALDASFTFSPVSPSAGQSVQFTDTSAGGPTAWYWSFNDGSSSTARNPSHAFAQAGSYSVTMVISKGAVTDEVTRVVSVSPSSTLSASFTVSPASPRVGEAVQFADTSVGGPTAWSWSFGDGGTSTLRNPTHTYATAGSKTVSLTAATASTSDTETKTVTVVAQTAVIVDHASTKLANIPTTWINQAKQTLRIAYGHTSHGSQLTTGMAGLIEWKGPLYAFNSTGADGALQLRDFYGDFGGYGIANDLGDPNRTAWEQATRLYLNANPTINVIIWSWCSQVGGTEAQIQLYLDLMSGLERDYPNVKFVYMTGRVSAKPLTEPTPLRNQQIRDYCAAHNKILYDFADIESWDPDGNYYGDKLVDEDCSYDSNGDGILDSNWAIDWQNAHPGEWYDCAAAHTQPLNANLKAYAAWWLWARLAGWDGR